MHTYMHCMTILAIDLFALTYLGSAIFFEFKHFKPKKHSISVKCFSLMEMDEIKPGKTFLEMLVSNLFVH